MSNENKVIFSLFDYWGSWGYPYHEAGYEVVQIDIQHGDDILTWDYKSEYPNCYGILAAPPCDNFCGSGARWWPKHDSSGETEHSLRLIHKTLEIVEYYNPTFWALENPVGRLNKLVPELKPFGPWYWEPFWFGDPYTKKTGLWGKFNRDLPINEVEPYEGSMTHQLGWVTKEVKNKRSRTPDGFAKAFFEANQ